MGLIDWADGDRPNHHLLGGQHRNIQPMAHIGLKILFERIQSTIEIAVRLNVTRAAGQIAQILGNFCCARILLLKIIMGQQPCRAIIAIAIAQVQPLGIAGEKLLERIGLAQHQPRHPRHGDMGELDRAIFRKLNDREKFREPLDIPCRISGGKMVQHEMMGIFVEEDFFRAHVEFAVLAAARQKRIGRPLRGRIMTRDIGVARQRLHLGLAGQHIDLHRAARFRTGHAGQSPQEEVELLQSFGKVAQFLVIAFAIDREMPALRLPPRRLRRSHPA
ncbi:hypothetical protein sphantq_02816 [Sphingobium sp. AntQ-1]|uniref:hypothetical protein n=1 Tax=Sphingobium sp. AntQ-1 TaxID=2930091 RepID=UPI0027A49DDF|nr:hypothetical protein sphantq_02816 [Sphingobium sp. AntQ-1]